MIEIVENAIQIVLSFLCAVFSFRKAAVTRIRSWLLLGLFYSLYFLGDLYWQLFLWYYGDTPRYAFIPYLSWYSGYLFLLMLLTDAYVFDWKKMGRRLWPVPLFTASMGIFYMTYGDYVSNTIAAILMGALLWRSLGGILSMRDKAGSGSSARALHITVALFCFVTYTVWTSTCFWSGDTWRNPYLWLDTVLSVVMLLLIPAQRKAVSG